MKLVLLDDASGVSHYINPEAVARVTRSGQDDSVVVLTSGYVINVARSADRVAALLSS